MEPGFSFYAALRAAHGKAENARGAGFGTAPRY
jgi:hypothetical protein